MAARGDQFSHAVTGRAMVGDEPGAATQGVGQSLIEWVDEFVERHTPAGPAYWSPFSPTGIDAEVDAAQSVDADVPL